MTANFYQFESEDKKSALINKAMDQVVWFTEESGNILRTQISYITTYQIPLRYFFVH